MVSTPSPQKPNYFKTVDLNAKVGTLGTLHKEGRIYVAPLPQGPLLIQTPPIQFKSISEGAAWLLPVGPFHTFLQETETLLKAAAVKNATTWGLSQDQVEQSYKSFFKGGNNGAFKVKVSHPDFVAFDAQGEPLDACEDTLVNPFKARAVLLLDKLCVGKTEMGALWTLVQVRIAPQPGQCLIDLEVEVPDDAEIGDFKGSHDEFV